MNCAKCDGGIESLTLFNLNCHTWLVRTILNSAALEKSQKKRIKDYRLKNLMEGKNDIVF